MKPLKSLAIISKLCILPSIFTHTNAAEIVLKDYLSAFGPHLETIGICYDANELKEHH